MLSRLLSLVTFLCIAHHLLWQTVTATSQQMSQGFSTALPSVCKTPCVFTGCIAVYIAVCMIVGLGVTLHKNS